jgi:hypothetical protein
MAGQVYTKIVAVIIAAWVFTLIGISEVMNIFRR